jgi:RecB family endonuclease NucS
MALFRVLDGQRAQQLRASPPRNEKQVQTLIERNLDGIFAVRFVATEFSTGQRQRGRIDTLGLDQDGSPVILEYKRASNENSSTKASSISTGSWTTVEILRSQRAT